MNEDYARLLKLASDLSEIKGLETRRSNLLDELYVDEDAHSRILRMILEYERKDHSFPCLEAFLKTPALRGVVPEWHVRPRFVNQEGKIDLLIETDTSSIIIENKVRNAPDQDAQIERYVEHRRARGVLPTQIYVIYLTKDGSKTVAEYSLTEKAKELLDMSDDDDGRFIRMDFRTHILGWLKGLSLEEPEDALISAGIDQYIDYLEGICGLGQENEVYHEQAIKKMEEYGITTIEQGVQALADIDTLKTELTHFLDLRCRELADQYLIDPLRKYCAGKGIELTDVDISYGNVWLRMSIPGLPHTVFGIETDGKGISYGLFRIGGDEKDDIPGLPFANFRATQWWPAWQYFSDTVYSPKSDFFWTIEIRGGSFLLAVQQQYEQLCEMVKRP